MRGEKLKVHILSFLSGQVGIFNSVFARTVLPSYGSCVNTEDDSLKSDQSIYYSLSCANEFLEVLMHV